ncbi:MAG: hypothetical protein R2719_00940 [Micropruina sp.]
MAGGLLIGLGALVRPDLAWSAWCSIMLLCQSERRIRGWLGSAGLALAIPVALLRSSGWATTRPWCRTPRWP